MIVRLRTARRTGRDSYRLSLELIDPGRSPWSHGDCVGQVDIIDHPGHEATPRGLLGPAVDLYRASLDEPPTGSDSRLLWDVGRAVHRYIGRLFEGGMFCPFSEPDRDGAQASGGRD